MDDDSRSPRPPSEADDDRPSKRDTRAGSQSDPHTTIDLLVIDPDALVTDDARRTIRDLTTRALTHHGAHGEIRVKLVRDPDMIRAHERSHNDPSTTDVITYDLRDSDTDPLDTDLIVCVDEAKRRSDELGHPIEHELTLYCVHGALHCLGYNDLDPESHTRMHAREDELLSKIGLGPIYAKRANGAPS
jgi:probable rRNA maturation factor